MLSVAGRSLFRVLARRGIVGGESQSIREINTQKGEKSVVKEIAKSTAQQVLAYSAGLALYGLYNKSTEPNTRHSHMVSPTTPSL